MDRPHLIPVLICAVSGVAGANDMTKTQERDLSKVERKIDQIEKAVASLETSKTRGTPAFPDAVERKGKQQDRRFEDAEKALDELPQVPSVEEQRKRLGDLRSRLEKVMKEAAAQTGAAATQEAAWNAHLASPVYEADRKAIHAFAASYEDFRFKLGDRSFRALLSETFEGTLELLAALPEVEAQREALVKRYEGFGRSGSGMLTHLETAKQALERCKGEIEKAKRGGAAHLAELGKALEEETRKVFALRDQAKAAGRPFPLGYSLMDRTSLCAQLEQQIRRTETYLVRIAPENERATREAAERALAGFRKAVADATAEIVASMRAPADDFRGPDAAAVKEFVAKASAGRVHGAKVLRVALSGNWERSKGFKWDRTAKAWVEVDRSSLAGTLILEHDGARALLRRIEVERDHKRSDALQLFGDFQAYPKPRPDQLLPLDKLD